MNTEVKVVASIVLVTILIIVGGVFIMSGQSSNDPEIKVDSSILVRPDSPIKKAEQDHITIVEFADYECPSCAALHPTLEKLLASENGKYINLVYRNFPLHAGSVQVATAVLAAGAQGKYWEMSDIVYEKQDEWASIPATKAADRAKLFEKYAASIGLDINKYREDLKNKAYPELISRDKADAITMNINATPTLIINGVEIVRGAIPYEQLEAIIESELAKNN